MVKPHKGVTLIELLVTIAILALLLLVGMPFTSAWLYRTRVDDATHKVKQGYDMAKALALRNPSGARASAVAAGLRVDGTALFVCSGDPGDSTTCGVGKSGVKWQATLPEGTTVTISGGSGTSQSIGLDNTGLPLKAANFSIANRSESEAGTFY